MRPAKVLPMRRIIPFALIATLFATPAMAQAYVGNWGCQENGVKSGMLTIYGDGYGFASSTFGDKSSGTGAIAPYSDGVGFNDGPLMTNAGIVAGRMVNDPAGGVALQLENSSTIVMVCTPR